MMRAGKKNNNTSRKKLPTVFKSCLALLLFIGLLAARQPVQASDSSYVAIHPGPDRFVLSEAGQTIPLYISENDHWGVIRALGDLQEDLANVTGARPMLHKSVKPDAGRAVLVGTIGKSGLIDRLIEQGKLDVDGIKGQWETYLLQTVENPLPDVEEALVIAGSDKRGTIFGIYDLSREIGVSPWHFMADVPPKKRSSLYVKEGRYTEGPPSVKYRGIFINDEAPALSGWVYEKFGEFNHEFYSHVFELILRMKGNFMWPAMWGRMFYVDDPMNPKVADRYGVVIGTSHHEPLMRAHAEWDKFGSGPWNYRKNDSTLRDFWRKGMERMNGYESLVTIGMRGDGDKPMSDERNIDLLEEIVSDQRDIIENVTGEDASETPQVWALYKEVQEYYDMGMTVPEDVTLLFADDNWGHIRRLPRVEESDRPGGFGVYYHFDYVGGPRSYKWINTNPLPKIWQQMRTAYEHNANRIWIVNVGDIKPMEFPTTFFLDYAWNPEQYPAESLPEYKRNWAQQHFGPQHADAIADILTKYSRYNGRRKPELLSADTYSLAHYREAERIVESYNKLAHRAETIYEQLPKEYRAAYYQLVLYPVKASANLNEMYVTLAKNRLYAEQGRAATNRMAAQVHRHFNKDAELARYYNEEVAGGKWSHMMDQSNIGYTSWDDPDHDIRPDADSIDVPEAADMGVAVQGTSAWWPNSDEDAVLPGFNKFEQQKYYVEIFNRGQRNFEYRVETNAEWLNVTESNGQVDLQKRLWVEVDWDNVPSGNHTATLSIVGPDDARVGVRAVVNNPATPRKEEITGFVESNGYVSMEAPHFTRAVNAEGVEWQRIPDFGRTLSAMVPMPATADPRDPDDLGPRLEYDVYLDEAGPIKLRAHLFPALDIHDTGGLRFAVSVDDGEPRVLNMDVNKSYQSWGEAVSNAIKIEETELRVDEPGKHTIKFWMVDPGVVLEKLVLDTGGLKPSYLGPPESFFRK